QHDRRSVRAVPRPARVLATNRTRARRDGGGVSPFRLLAEDAGGSGDAFLAVIPIHRCAPPRMTTFRRVNALGDRTADYDFDLPPSLIAQQPLERRDASRLMVVDRASGEISHRTFADLPELIDPRDVLVVNRTRVLRARLLGTRASGAPAEILLLK